MEANQHLTLRTKTMKLHRFIFLLLASIATANAQEICGVQGVGYNSLFKNGFEALLSAAAATTETPKNITQPSKVLSVISLGSPVGFAPVANGGTPTILITSPSANGSIVGRTLQIRGTLTGPINTGVSVNGVPAYVQENQFVTSLITLPATGQTTLTATATTLDGAIATDAITVSPGPGNGVIFTSAKRAEYTNRAVNFAFSLDPTITVQSITVDFNGDGTPEFTGSNPSLVPTAYTYTQSGVFTAEARVTTVGPNSQVLVSKTIIGAIDIVDHRTRVCSVYGALRARLTANDVPGAIKVFPQESRATYEALFNALGTNRPVFATRMGTIATGLLTLIDASMTIVTTNQAQTRAYRVRFAQGADGVWRIEEM